MKADKDVDGLLSIFVDELTTIVCTTAAGTLRAPLRRRAGRGPRASWARIGFGSRRPWLSRGLRVVALADDVGPGAEEKIAGSVIAAGQARALLVREEQS